MSHNILLGIYLSMNGIARLSHKHVSSSTKTCWRKCCYQDLSFLFIIHRGLISWQLCAYNAKVQEKLRFPKTWTFWNGACLFLGLLYELFTWWCQLIIQIAFLSLVLLMVLWEKTHANIDSWRVNYHLCFQVSVLNEWSES